MNLAARRPARSRRSLASLTALSLLGAGVALPVLTVAVPAKAAVTVGENISVFPNRDMVVAVGYDLGEELTIEVLRNDTIIGTTTGPALETAEGIGLEVNHGPEGTPAPGECWTSYTPDIIGGDLIRVTTARGVDSMVVADVDFSGSPRLDAAGNVVVDGTATGLTASDIAVEFRRDKPEPRFRRGPFPAAFSTPTTWSSTFRPSTGTSAEGLTTQQQRDIALNEASWAAVVDNVSETTLAELGEPGGVAAGCTGTAEANTLVGGLDPINIASGDITLSGTARAGVSAVSIKVGALAAKDATVSTNTTGTKTWTLGVTKAELETLPDGNVAIASSFDGLAGATRNVLKDTTAPLAPTPSVPPGRVSTAQSVALNKPANEGTSKVYWEIGASAVPDPDEFSTLYTGQISVTSTQTIKARLIDAAGNPGAVGSFTYTFGPVAPAAPTIGTPAAGNGSATVRWTAPTDNGGSGITSYSVRAYNAAGTVVSTTTAGGSATTVNVTGLTNGTAYTFDVRAINAAGTSVASERSAAVTPQAVATAPGAPTAVAGTAGNASVSVRWTAPASNGGSAITGYLVRAYTGTGTTVVSTTTAAATATSVNVTGLTNGTGYTFDVRAVNAIGNSAPSTRSASVTPVAPAPAATAPGAPTGVAGTAGNASVSVRWTAPASNGGSAITGYSVRAYNGTTVFSTTTAAATATSVNVTGLTNGTPYTFDVRAVNAIGTSAASTRSTAVTPQAAAVTRTLTLTPNADTQVKQAGPTVNWGNHTGLWMSTQDVSTSTSSRVQSYVRYTVPALATGERITAATLSVNVTNATTNGPAIHRTSPTWNEGTMTWNTGRPARLSTTASAAGNFGSMALGRRTATVTGVTAAGEVSFELAPEVSDGVGFSSSEATTTGTQPQLILTITR